MIVLSHLSTHRYKEVLETHFTLGFRNVRNRILDMVVLRVGRAACRACMQHGHKQRATTQSKDCITKSQS